VNEPVVKEGGSVVRPAMRLTLSCDHRVIDGAVGAAFLQELKRIIESPLRSLLLMRLYKEEGNAMRKGAVEKLRSQLEDAAVKHTGIRENKTRDIFSDRRYITPDDLLVTNYLRRRPVAAFNPGGMLLNNGMVMLFPRLVFDYYTYNSSIGLILINMDDLLVRRIAKPIECEIVLWPDKIWEFGHGCEDARVHVHGDLVYLLYTGSKHYHDERGRLVKQSVQALATLELHQLDCPAKKLGYFSVMDRAGEKTVMGCKDSAFLKFDVSEASMLLRLDVGDRLACWRGKADLSSMTFDLDSLYPVMLPESWEHKVGWSTNAIEYAPGKYLVGWHAVMKEDLSYKNGLAVVDEVGKLLAASNYLLVPSGVNEWYGDRGGVIFGDTLILYEDRLIWIGGVSDYAMGVFVADLDTVLSSLRPV